MATVKNIRHTGIVVTDMERAVEFYRDLLGLETAIDFTEKGDYIDNLSAMTGVRLRMVKLVAPEGGMIELLQYLSHPEGRDPDNRFCEIGPTHVAFTVTDVDGTYREWSERGISFNSSPQLSPDGKAKVVFCRDPDGTFLEIVEELQERS